MKLNKYKFVGFLFAAFFISSLCAQKFDKKFSENFTVNQDVILAINATNADINVTTWDRNEVSVTAQIIVEGLSKKEAEKFLNKWEFEALGNKSKVQINANANHFLHFGNDFSFDFIGDINFPEVEIPEIDFKNIDISIPEINFPDIEIPEINLNLEDILSEIDDYDFEVGDDEERTFSFKSNGKRKTVTIKSKKEWEAFKKTKDYEDMKTDLQKSIKEVKQKLGKLDKKEFKAKLEKAKIKFEKIDKKKLEEKIEKARLVYKEVDKEKIRESLEKAKASIEKMKMKFSDSYKNGNNVIVIEDGKNKKKVKITRKITVKVPSKAKFDLNTRHSKVKLPKGNTVGKVSYGTFYSNGLQGGNLKIYYAPVNINSLNACNLFLNNVTDAKFASVTNTVLNSNSSGVKINNVNQDVDITNKFGELTIDNLNPNYNSFNLFLNYSSADINLSKIKGDLSFVIGEKSPEYSKKPSIKYNSTMKNKEINGNFTIKSKNEKLKINGKYSQLAIKNN